jgi:hypothetical protein
MDKKITPMIGIGDWLAKEARLDDAKAVVETIHRSKKSTDDDKKAADKLLADIKRQKRDVLSKTVKQLVVMRPVDKLHPHKEIASKMVVKAKDFEEIKEDIEERGVQVPIVVNEKSEVVCGITRWKVCKALGFNEIPCFEGSWDLYNDMLDYAIKDNVMRRQLSDDERINLTSSMKREKNITFAGRPPVPSLDGTKRQREAVTKKVQKILSKANAAPKKTRELEKVFEKDYKWVVGKNSLEDSTFPTKVADEVKKQLELLQADKADIRMHVKYEVRTYEN